MVYIDRNGEEAAHAISQCKPFRPNDSLSEILYSLRSLTHTRSDICDIYITEVLLPNDTRKDSSEFKKAIEKEIRGLIERGTWKPSEEF